MDGVHVARPTDTPHATDYVDADGGPDRRARRPRTRPTSPTTACTSRSTPCPTTGCWPSSRSTSCWPEAATAPWSAPSTSATRPTSPSGSWPSRTSRRGRRRGATGRPGWHTECVVMSLELLGEGFDLHCGGLDLKFPHHENERAQAVALGKRFANHWMHHAFVVDAEGEKMSKSLGNFDNLLDLIETRRSPGLPDGAAAGPLPLAGTCRPGRRKRPSGALGRLDGLARRAWTAALTTRRPTSRSSMRSRGAWTTTSTRRGHGGALRHRDPGQRRPRRR